MPEEGQEIEVAEAWIKSQVAQELSNAGLGSWKVEPEPYVGALPAVTFVLIGGDDEEPSDSGDILMSPLLYRVVARAVGTTLKNTRVAARAIHKALHRTSGSNAYGSVYWSRRERPVRVTFNAGQEPEALQGGEYRISVKGS